jgi:hypothetical protein
MVTNQDHFFDVAVPTQFEGNLAAAHEMDRAIVLA